MTKTQLTITALTALALAQGAYIMVDAKPVQVEITAEPTTDAVLLAATPEVREAAEAVTITTKDKDGNTATRRACEAPEKCESGVWDGTKRVMTEGWCCGGAFLPQAVADGLDVAAVEAAKPKVVEVPAEMEP